MKRASWGFDLRALGVHVVAPAKSPIIGVACFTVFPANWPDSRKSRVAFWIAKCPTSFLTGSTGRKNITRTSPIRASGDCPTPINNSVNRNEPHLCDNAPLGPACTKQAKVGICAWGTTGFPANGPYSCMYWSASGITQQPPLLLVRPTHEDISPAPAIGLFGLDMQVSAKGTDIGKTGLTVFPTNTPN